MTAILFRNARIFDGTGAEPFSGEVLVEGDTIAAVSHTPIEAGDARLVDCGGKTLMPGLIDGHGHLAMGSSVEQISKPGNRSEGETALLVAHCGRVMLDHGFTSVYSGGSASPRAEVDASRAFARNIVPGPRLRSASFERVPGGEMGLTVKFEGAETRAANAAETASFVAEMAGTGVDSVKFLLGGVSAFVPGANLRMQFHEEEIAAAAETAREKKVWLTAHAYTPEAISMAVRHGFRMLYHCTWADEQSLDLLEQHKDSLFVGPAPGITEADLLRAPKFGVMASPAQQEEQAEAAERLKKIGAELKKRGIRSVVGGDYGFPWNPIGRNARDIELFVDWFGYTPAEALYAATGEGNALMALDKPVGLVKEGAYADLLLIDGDPTTEISLVTQPAKMSAIMINGRFHKAPAP